MEKPGGQADLAGRADQLSPLQDDPGHAEGGQLQAAQGCHWVELISDKSALLQIWHEIDMKIAHYHVEACDNAKYLGATEQYSHRIYLEVNLWKMPEPIFQPLL